MEVLEYRADVSPLRSQPPFGQPPQIAVLRADTYRMAVNPHLTAAAGLQEVDATQQGRVAGDGGPHYHHLAGVHIPEHNGLHHAALRTYRAGVAYDGR